MTVAEALDRLEQHYGKLRPVGPTDAYEMILYTNCGYPANDITCAKGFEPLKKQIGLDPEKILAAPDTKLAAITKAGGMFPELRATRLKEIASVVLEKSGGNLAVVLKKPLPEARKALKQFPTIGDPGAEKILLFCGVSQGLPLESNGLRVLTRFGYGRTQKDYGATYRSAQEALSGELPANAQSLAQAHLLLREHGKTLCKTNGPKCVECPLADSCAYAAKK